MLYKKPEQTFQGLDLMSQPLGISIILNKNRCDDTLACLASQRDSTYANNEVLVLDNNYTDGSASVSALLLGTDSNGCLY